MHVAHRILAESIESRIQAIAGTITSIQHDTKLLSESIADHHEDGQHDDIRAQLDDASMALVHAVTQLNLAQEHAWTAARDIKKVTS